MAKLFVPRERMPGERRVSVTPDSARQLVADGLTVIVEAGAGEASHYPDDAYREAGATVTDASADAWRDADVVTAVRAPGQGAAPDAGAALAEGAVLVGFLAPHRNLDAVRGWREGKVTACSLELVPRISRAQRMDALSSQANISGYRAAVMAAYLREKHFPLSMTAAGTIRPARVVVLGAGVAGLQAIATARRLGALVEASDIREAAKGEVESLGASFIDPPAPEGEGEGGYARQVGEDFLSAQQRILGERLAEADAVISTAFVPGKPAPKLVTRAMVDGMKPGAVIIDLAAEEGGNCELTRAGEEVDHQGVRVVGATNLPSALAPEASQLYARNVLEFLRLLVSDGEVTVDLDDEIVDATVVTMGGEVRHQPTAQALEAAGAPDRGGRS